MESAWLVLQDGVIRARSLDEIIHCHDSYLADILDRALLTAKHEIIHMQIQLLLQSIIRFCHLESSLLTGKCESNVVIEL